MAGAPFDRDLEVPASPETAWGVLTDVERMASWVAVLEKVEVLAELEHYSAVLADRLGPFKLRADLDILLSDVEINRRVRVRAEGEDRQVASRITIDAVLSIEPRGEGSMVRVQGSYDVAGRVATLGASIIAKKADHLLAEFFDAAKEALS
jgi:carbon monoxide dehydrogenase subunit G